MSDPRHDQGPTDDAELPPDEPEEGWPEGEEGDEEPDDEEATADPGEH